MCNAVEKATRDSRGRRWDGSGTWWASVDTATAITALVLSIPSLVPVGRQAVAVRGTSSHECLGIEGRAGLLRLRSTRLIPTYPS